VRGKGLIYSGGGVRCEGIDNVKTVVDINGIYWVLDRDGMSPIYPFALTTDTGVREVRNVRRFAAN
jgi:hypothetical protein